MPSQLKSIVNWFFLCTSKSETVPYSSCTRNLSIVLRMMIFRSKSDFLSGAYCSYQVGILFID